MVVWPIYANGKVVTRRSRTREIDVCFTPAKHFNRHYATAVLNFKPKLYEFQSWNEHVLSSQNTNFLNSQNTNMLNSQNTNFLNSQNTNFPTNVTYGWDLHVNQKTEIFMADWKLAKSQGIVWKSVSLPMQTRLIFMSRSWKSLEPSFRMKT